MYKVLTMNRGKSFHETYTSLHSELEVEAVKIEKIAVAGMCVCVCVRARVCVSLCVCMYVCMYACMYVKQSK